jgi:hypothetical protein
MVHGYHSFWLRSPGRPGRPGRERSPRLGAGGLSKVLPRVDKRGTAISPIRGGSFYAWANG